MECHGHTLLPQFLGVYPLTAGGVENYMAVTRKVFSRGFTVHCKYDLKRPAVPREASDKRRPRTCQNVKTMTYGLPQGRAEAARGRGE